MSDPTSPDAQNKGGRPRKYGSPDERKAAVKAARIAKRLAPPPLADNTASEVTPLQASIAAAVSGLSIPDATFVTSLCGGATPANAYRRAHPSHPEKTASSRAAVKSAEPKVAKAIHLVKEALSAAAAYGFANFMEEMTEAMIFAKATKNATALVRAVELRGKATGTLNDKPVSAASGFVLNITGVNSPDIALEPAE